MTYCTAARCARRSGASSFRNEHRCRYAWIGEIPRIVARRNILSDVFGISVGALRAFQSAIDVTSNNIANANTPGYAKEAVNLTAAAPQSNGVLSVGNGVVVSGISRSFNQATA